MKNKIFAFSGSVRKFMKAHKVASAVIGIVVIIIAYSAYGKITAKTAATQYVLGTVEKGTLISSVSGTGQVSASNQLDVKPKVSGEITSVKVASGQIVKEGAVLATIDSRDASTAVNDAYVSLVSAKISLEKTKTASSQTKDGAVTTLTKAYDDAYNSLSDMFTSYSTILSAADTILNSSSASPYMSSDAIRSIVGNSGVDTKASIVNKFGNIKNEYDALYTRYKTLNSANNNQTEIESLVADSYTTSKKFADFLKLLHDFNIYLQNAAVSITSQMTTDKTALEQNMSTVNIKVSSLLTTGGTIKDAKDNFNSVNQTYYALSGSNDTLDVQTAQITVDQKRNAYQQALNNLSDYTVRAPFDGIIAASDIKKGDNASASTVVATLITKQQIATISLNEIDAAKVAVGDKATLTFDAFPDLTISGKVIEVDALGTVSQGVVNYNWPGPRNLHDILV